jgi:hypothetical protein
MKSSIKVSMVIVCVCLATLLWAVNALFHGSFDKGTFEVQQSQPSQSKQLAMIGKRPDHQAMSGDQYFIIIGDHLFSPAELRHAYYYDGVAFRAGSSCLTIQWVNDHELEVKCEDHSIQPDQIAIQKDKVGSVTILYEGIPAMTKQ